ncbi:three-helix bundle dimerization domain-containing protein [Rhodococcus sp. NPDC003322]
MPHVARRGTTPDRPGDQTSDGQHPERSAAHIRDAVTRARAHFTTSPVRDFVPLLIERHAEHELSGDAPIAQQ